MRHLKNADMDDPQEKDFEQTVEKIRQVWYRVRFGILSEAFHFDIRMLGWIFQGTSLSVGSGKDKLFFHLLRCVFRLDLFIN